MLFIGVLTALASFPLYATCSRPSDELLQLFSPIQLWETITGCAKWMKWMKWRPILPQTITNDQTHSHSSPMGVLRLMLVFFVSGPCSRRIRFSFTEPNTKSLQSPASLLPWTHVLPGQLFLEADGCQVGVFGRVYGLLERRALYCYVSFVAPS